MDSLNLNIDSYTPVDLKNLFSLSPVYSSRDVDRGKAKLLIQLDKSKSLDPESKRRIAFFIDTASSKLGGMRVKKDSNAGTWAMKENPMDTGSSHFVISDSNVIAGRNAKIVDGRQAGTDDVPPGWLNPINVRTVMMGMNIDTRFRDHYYETNSADFMFDLPHIQRKVTNMRIATIDIPMTYYAIDRSRGDATMLVFPIENDGSSSGTSESEINSWTTSPSISEVNTWFDTSATNTTNPATQYGVWQGEANYSIVSFTLPSPALEGSYRAAWLVVLPDGNYEMAWNAQSNAHDITRAMNTALSMAQPCVVDTGTGNTYILLDNNNLPIITQGLGGKVVFSVDRNSGRSIFALPSSSDGTGSDSTPPIMTNGFELAFPINSSGNFAPETNLQLRLGWQLGFRIGQYRCDGSSSSGATAVSSEGICLVTGPRYMYISIEDGNNNSSVNFTTAFTESTMGEHVMTRINLASSMDSVGVFKCASDMGLSNQLNRTREFFGPVHISRLKIKLLDEYGRTINLNHMDWSMSVVFEKLYN